MIVIVPDAVEGLNDVLDGLAGEAAAATAVVEVEMSAISSPQETLEVRADRPFAWAVVERGTGTILFAGVVADPR